MVDSIYESKGSLWICSIWTSLRTSQWAVACIFLNCIVDNEQNTDYNVTFFRIILWKRQRCSQYWWKFSRPICNNWIICKRFLKVYAKQTWHEKQTKYWPIQVYLLFVGIWTLQFLLTRSSLYFHSVLPDDVLQGNKLKQMEL